MKRTILFALLSLLSTAVTSSCLSSDDERPRVAIDPVPPSARVLEAEVARFADWTTGSFVATEGSETRLDCVRVWSERPELWLFLEVRRHDASIDPTVEVWRIERRNDSSLRVHVYDLPAPRPEFHGEWEKPVPLAAIGPKDLLPRSSDTLLLIDRGTSFQGGTSGQSGVRALRVVIGAHRLLWRTGGTHTAPPVTLSFARVP